MSGLWTPDQAKQLLQAGVITQDQYQRNMQMNDPFGSGAAANGITPQAAPPAPAQGTPPPDPFAAGAAQAGIAPKELPAPDAVDPSQVVAVGGVPLRRPPIGPPGPPPTQMNVAGFSKPVTVSGGITVNRPGTAPSAPTDGSAATAPGPQVGPRAPANSPAKATPSASPGYSEDDVRAIAGRPPLSDRERRDPEFKKRVAEYDSMHRQVDKATDDEQAARDKKTDVAVKEAQETYAARQMGNAIVQGMKAKDAGERDKDLAAQKQYLDGLNHEADSIAKTKLNANRLFANQTTGDKILAGIMTFFGAAGASRDGARNVGNSYTEAVNRAISQDLDIQRSQLENRKAALTQKRGIYADMVKLYGDKDAGRLASEAAMKDMVANRYDEIGARYAPDKAQADGNAASAALRKQAAEDRFNAQQMIANRLDQQRAAAAAAAAANSKLQSERRWELLKENNKEAYGALKQAQTDGTQPPKWALDALSFTASDVPTPTAGSGGGMTKEQRGKMAMERAEKGRAAEADDAQLDAMDRSPVIKSPATGAAIPGITSGIGQRIAPDAAKTATDIDAFNANMNAMGGKAIKDNEGRIPPAMLEQLHKFNLDAVDTPEQKAEKVRNFREWMHNRQLESGARDPEARGPAPGNKEDPYAKYRVR